MATVITSECINCGACEPECPNTAIYQGGVEWELNGVKHPPLSADYFYIVPDKCTECVGFYDKEACAVVCPVDCCVPDPQRPEEETPLFSRARTLHPDRHFEADFPSRFKVGGATVAVPTPAPVPVPPAPPKPVAAAGPAPVAAPKAEPAVVAAANVATVAPAASPAPQPAAVVDVAPAAAAAAVPQVHDGPSLPPIDEWQVPIDCHHCKQSFTQSFRHFRSGVVLHCPHCQGSIVVTTTMHNTIAQALKEFYSTWERDYQAFQDKRRQQLDAFVDSIHRAHLEFHPPGAPRKRSWIFG